LTSGGSSGSRATATKSL